VILPHCLHTRPGCISLTPSLTDTESYTSSSSWSSQESEYDSDEPEPEASLAGSTPIGSKGRSVRHVIHHHHHHVHHHHHGTPGARSHRATQGVVQSDLLWLLGIYRLVTLQLSIYDVINYFRDATPHQQLFFLSSPRLFLYLVQFCQFFQVTMCAVMIATWAGIVSVAWYYQIFVVIAAVINIFLIFPLIIYMYSIVMNVGEYSRYDFIHELNLKAIHRGKMKREPSTLSDFVTPGEPGDLVMADDSTHDHARPRVVLRPSFDSTRPRGTSNATAPPPQPPQLQPDTKSSSVPATIVPPTLTVSSPLEQIIVVDDCAAELPGTTRTTTASSLQPRTTPVNLRLAMDGDSDSDTGWQSDTPAVVATSSPHDEPPPRRSLDVPRSSHAHFDDSDDLETLSIASNSSNNNKAAAALDDRHRHRRRRRSTSSAAGGGSKRNLRPASVFELRDRRESLLAAQLPHRARIYSHHHHHHHIYHGQPSTTSTTTATATATTNAAVTRSSPTL